MESIEYDVDPEEFESEEEFLEALKEAKTAWRNDYSFENTEHAVDPEEFESEDKFLETFKKAEEEWCRENVDIYLEHDVAQQNHEPEDVFFEAVEEVRNAWREKYSNAYDEYYLDPDEYDTEAEFEAAIAERVEWQEKWRDKADLYCLWIDEYASEEEFIEDYMVYWKESLQDKANEYAMCIDDYETDDDFLEAYENIKAERTAMGAYEPCGVLELDAIDPKSYRDMETYQAAYKLKEEEVYDYSSLSDHERYIYRLMVECPFPQGKYLDKYWGFRYNEAIADHLTLPIGIDKEDLADESTITDVLDYIARVDEAFCFTAWKWCMETFWPYCKYHRDLVTRVLSNWTSLNEVFRNSLLDELCTNQELRSILFEEDKEWNSSVVVGAPNVLYDILQSGKSDVAVELYRFLRKNTLVTEKEQFDIIEELIDNCCNYDELETLELFMETILPLTKDFPQEKLAWRKKEWMQRIQEYVDHMEEGSERYAFSRRYAWRAQYKDEAEFFDMTLEHYDSEESFVEHLKQKRYFYEKQQRRLNPKEEAITVPETIVPTNTEIAEDDNEVYHFVGIVFSHGGQVYSYLTKDETIKVGDEVIVPTAHGEAKVKVVSTTACLRAAAPYDVEKAKYILRKVEAEE